VSGQKSDSCVFVCKRHRFSLILRFWYLILKLFGQCAIFVFCFSLGKYIKIEYISSTLTGFNTGLKEHSRSHYFKIHHVNMTLLTISYQDHWCTQKTLHKNENWLQFCYIFQYTISHITLQLRLQLSFRMCCHFRTIHLRYWKYIQIFVWYDVITLVNGTLLSTRNNFRNASCTTLSWLNTNQFTYLYIGLEIIIFWNYIDPVINWLIDKDSIHYFSIGLLTFVIMAGCVSWFPEIVVHGPQHNSCGMNMVSFFFLLEFMCPSQLYTGQWRFKYLSYC
jgi:hypothetical protein